MARVKAHTRKTKDGKIVSVRSYNNKKNSVGQKSDGLQAYYRKYRRDIDDIIDQTGVSLRDAVESHKMYMENDYNPKVDMPPKLNSRKGVRVKRSCSSSSCRIGSSFYK